MARFRLARWHEAAHVRHQADKRRHPEVGALTRHVGSSDERKVARRRCVDVVGHERVLTKKKSPARVCCPVSGRLFLYNKYLT